MIIMGIDLGFQRTGIAVSDALERLASPVEVISEHARSRLLRRVLALIEERGVEHIVVGLPIRTNGEEGDKAENARSFGAELAEQTGLPVVFYDERGTTVTAHNLMNETNTRGARRKAAIDAVAATIILQNYLDFRRNQRG